MADHDYIKKVFEERDFLAKMADNGLKGTEYYSGCYADSLDKINELKEQLLLSEANRTATTIDPEILLFLRENAREHPLTSSIRTLSKKLEHLFTPIYKNNESHLEYPMSDPTDTDTDIISLGHDNITTEVPTTTKSSRSTRSSDTERSNGSSVDTAPPKQKRGRGSK